MNKITNFIICTSAVTLLGTLAAGYVIVNKKQNKKIKQRHYTRIK